MAKGGWIWLGIFLLLGVISLIFDSNISLFFKSLQNSFLTYFLGIFRPFLAMILLGLVIAAFLFIEHKRKWVVPLVITLASSTIISYILKFIFMRARPFGYIEYIPFTKLLDYSFPSSHAMFIFSALPILDKEFPKLKYIWIAIACLIAISRLYFGIHYMSDIIFGGLLGYLIGYLILNKTQTIRKAK